MFSLTTDKINKLSNFKLVGYEKKKKYLAASKSLIIFSMAKNVTKKSSSWWIYCKVICRYLLQCVFSWIPSDFPTIDQFSYYGKIVYHNLICYNPLKVLKKKMTD